MSRFAANLLLALAMPCAGLRCDKATTAKSRYPVFPLFAAGAGFSLERDRDAISELSTLGRVEAEVRSIAARIGTEGDKCNKPGFAIGPRTLDPTDQHWRELMPTSFATAARIDVVEVLNIDNSTF